MATVKLKTTIPHVTSRIRTASRRWLRFIADVFRQPIVIAILLSSVFYVLIARHNAAVAFSMPTDESLHKLSVLLKLSFWIVLATMIYSLIIFIKKIRSGNIFFRRWLLYFSLYFAVLFAVFLLIHPGHWVWDEFNILEVVKTYTPYAWQNYFTNVYYTFCLLLFPSAISIVVVQITLIAIIVGYIAAVVRSLTKHKYAPYLLMSIFLLPPILINNLYPLRITLYSYAEILLFAYLLNSYIKNKLKITPKGMVFVFFLIGILAFWRSEGIYYLLLVPVLLITSNLINKNNWKDFSTHAILTPSYLVLAVLGIVTYISNDSRYAITTMINPLSVMIHEPLRGGKLQEKLADMNKTIDLDVLRAYPSHTEIPSYWNNLLRPDYTGGLKSFRSDYAYIVAHNPDYFLKARIKTFLATNGLTKEYPPVLPVGLLGRDGELSASEKIVAQHFVETNAFTKPLNPQAKQFFTDALLGIDKQDKLTPIGHVFWNLIIPILLLLIVFMHSIKKRHTFWVVACIFILLRIPIIFITAPASYFMYYLPVYISGFTIPLIYLLIHSRKLNPAKVK